MKKIYTTLVLLFAMSFTNAQVVSIPDINFKLYLLSASSTNQIAKDLNGNWTKIDTNNDNLIQQSEANNISYLSASGQNNIIGIQAFSNLIELKTAINNTLNPIDLSGMTHLVNLTMGGTCFSIDLSNCINLKNFIGWYYEESTDYYGVDVKTVNLTNCVSLEIFDIRYNCTLLSFDGTGLINLKELYLNGYQTQCVGCGMYGNSYLQSVNLTDCVNLKKFSAFKQKLSNIDLSNLSFLEEVDISNQFDQPFYPHSTTFPLYQTINLSGCNNLKIFKSKGNYFTNGINFNGLQNIEDIDISYFYSENNDLLFDIENCPNLKHVKCNGDNFNEITTTLLFLNSNSLQSIDCSGNKMVELNLTNLDNLLTLKCFNNQLTTLNLSNCSSLQTLQCQNNQLTSLDLSSCGNLQTVNCDNNNLEYVSFKNNTNETKTFLNNPDLTYICADDAEQQSVQLIVNLYEMWDTCVVGDYCSFNPNGNFNTISGNALYDNENDGCDINDEVFQFLRVNLNDGTNSGSTFTNFEGDYTFYMNSGNFTLTPQLENPTYFNVSPATTQISFANTNNNSASQDFCITPNGVHNDVEVVLAQVTPARPGFDAEYSLVYKNKGNQPLSGAVSVAFDDAKLDFVSSSIIPTSNTTGLLSWNYSNLLPFENRSITFTLNVNSPQETPAVNNGDVLVFTANITPLTGDEIPEDNTFVYNQIVVGSYDPNDIYCLEGESLDPNMIGKYLHYNVRFENIGSAAAENVVVATTINAAEYDLNSLQVLNASHNVYTRINGNNVEFIFENCQLAGSPSGGHGNILFKMKSLSSLQTNDDVTSNANIFFDYNFPIETNDATTIFETLSNQEFTKDNSVKVYPNPAKETVTISANSNLSSITIYDVQGRIIQFIKANELEKAINLSNLSNGIYILDIVSEKGRMVEKLVKE